MAEQGIVALNEMGACETSGASMSSMTPASGQVMDESVCTTGRNGVRIARMAPRRPVTMATRRVLRTSERRSILEPFGGVAKGTAEFSVTASGTVVDVMRA